MIEMGFALLFVIFSGYTSGSLFVKLLKNIQYSYHTKNYLIMTLNFLIIPLVPVLFVVIIILAGLGVEVLYIFSTGQI